MTFYLGTCLKQIYAAFVGTLKGKIRSNVIEDFSVKGLKLLGAWGFINGIALVE